MHACLHDFTQFIMSKSFLIYRQDKQFLVGVRFVPQCRASVKNLILAPHMLSNIAETNLMSHQLNIGPTLFFFIGA